MCATRKRPPTSTRRPSTSRWWARWVGRRSSSAASASDNHHDLALFSVGADAPGPEQGRVGLYHLAWEVPTIDDLVDARAHLSEMGALVGESDHGVSKSLYAQDIDGIEFEVLWSVPREAWGDYEKNAVSQPLDLASEQARYGSRAAR